MHAMEERGERPTLRKLVEETSRALALLDADRLEELAWSCQTLNRDLEAMHTARRRALACQAREAAGEMAVLERVLGATRANLNVMRRLRELREGGLEYGQAESDGCGWTVMESRHGNN